MTPSEYTRYLQTGHAEDWREPDPSHSHKCPDCHEKRFCNQPGCIEAYRSFCPSCLDEVRQDIAAREEE
jgi:hypothetical protein